jgi:hypothetical protein
MPSAMARVASSAVTAAPSPCLRALGSVPTPVISATSPADWQLPAASGPSSSNAAASTECPAASVSRIREMPAWSLSAASLSRSAGPAGPTPVPGCAKATSGTATMRARSGSSQGTVRTVAPAGSCVRPGRVSRIISGWAVTSSPAPAAASVRSGATCAIHSKDSGMPSSRWRARTLRTSATVIRARAPRFGLA